MRRLLLLGTLAGTAAPLSAQTAAPLTKAAETITAADVGRHIGVIAADSMMGRDTPSRGLELTAQYIADQFKTFGLKPGGDSGTWMQRYPLPDDEKVTVPNTIAILEGSDPKLKNEYIVFTAHMDHLGISRGEADSINNGADDNGSGTVGVIELAEAFSQPGARPRRSLVFLTVSGEEKGLWGTEYFIQHSPIPLQQVVANINFDMIGRNSADTIIVQGKLESDLGATLDLVAAAHPELKMFPFARGSAFSYSSDNYYFARKGIPALYFYSGGHADYHRPSDSPEKIRVEKVARVLRLVFYLGQDVANAEPRPQLTQAGRQQLEQ